ncbi:MAG TPA: DUF5681 domain-containing protein [Anaerolineae bacterium]
MAKRNAKRAETEKPQKPEYKRTPVKQGVNSEVGYRNPPKKYQFKPGQSGNPAGRKPLAITLAQHVRDIGSEVVDAATNWTRLDAVLRRLYNDAMDGKAPAADILLERGWGKVIQPIDVTVWQNDYASAIRQGVLTLPSLESQFGRDGALRILSDIAAGGYMTAAEIQERLNVQMLADGLFGSQVETDIDK